MNYRTTLFLYVCFKYTSERKEGKAYSEGKKVNNTK